MIINIEIFRNIKSKVLKIETIYGTFYFYELHPKAYNYKIEYLAVFEHPNGIRKYIGSGALNIHGFFNVSDKEKYPVYELMFFNNLKDDINNYIINIKKLINEVIAEKKDFYSASQAENILDLDNIYFKIVKIEKELKHTKLEEVLI